MTKRIFKLRNVAMIACLAAMTMFSGCKKDPVTDPDNPDNPTGNMVNMEVTGIVNDVNGNPLSGVKVTTGTKSATTGADGTFSFTQADVVNNRAIVKLEKNGYFSLVRSGEKADGMYIKAVLTPKGNTANSLQTTFDAAVGATLQVAGAKVVIAPNGIMNKDGSAYSGTVKVDMRYLDPYTKNFSLMIAGGNYVGINKAGEEVILLSVGIIGVELTDNQNNPLQLKSGTPADVTYPIPAGMNGTLPATVPVSTFDEQKGIWVEETVATLQGGVYVGQVTHFSDESLTPKISFKTIKGRVIDCDRKPISGAGVYIEVVTSFCSLPLDLLLRTDSKGEWSARIPTGDHEIDMLAAWTKFTSDDDYTEKYTMEGDFYISQLCNEGQGFFEFNQMVFELPNKSAGCIPPYLSFDTKHGIPIGILITLGEIGIGDNIPEGKFPVNTWVATLPNNGALGNFDMDGNILIATLEIKKIDTDRYEFNFEGMATYYDESGPDPTPYPCRLYYESGKYKGINWKF